MIGFALIGAYYCYKYIKLSNNIEAALRSQEVEMRACKNLTETLEKKVNEWEQDYQWVLATYGSAKQLIEAVDSDFDQIRDTLVEITKMMVDMFVEDFAETNFVLDFWNGKETTEENKKAVKEIIDKETKNKMKLFAIMKKNISIELEAHQPSEKMRKETEKKLTDLEDTLYDKLNACKKELEHQMGIKEDKEAKTTTKAVKTKKVKVGMPTEVKPKAPKKAGRPKKVKEAPTSITSVEEDNVAKKVKEEPTTITAVIKDNVVTEVKKPVTRKPRAKKVVDSELDNEAVKVVKKAGRPKKNVQKEEKATSVKSRKK